MWGIWLLYWIVSASGVKRARLRELPASRLMHVLPVIVGAVLIVGPNMRAMKYATPLVGPLQWVGFGLVTAGLAFAIWARWHLGANWSAKITVKEDHELIRTGPYGWARHPIYTGLLTAVLGTAIAVGRWPALLGVAIIAASYIRKLRIEEHRMREVFGEQYVRYQAEVSALIPFVF